ncbi:MYG1 family protein [Fodinisporobacter ferrooxydans]|uniref:MYG1 family protein n=1 Tax=Fodinisporobacter ferrooxydans TaxID=2901836 RepID=A0ABY4CX51_9BACL|nr:MYG1 family protein [Alicyclobacillaceae bacterium MYW30-H2]
MKLGTHSQTFHADDVYATVFLLHVYNDAEIVRSREEDVLKSCDIVYDVGRGKYDHHSRDKMYRENGIPYAASGLIWRDFGKQIIKNAGIQEADVIETIAREIDEEMVQPLDAIDNGIEIEKSLPILDIASVVRLMNPAWDAEDSEDEAFQKAVSITNVIFSEYLNKKLAGYRAVPIVKRAFETREMSQLLVLPKGCPWEKTLLRLDQKKEVLFVITPRKNGQFTIQSVPPQSGSFAKRKPFPDDWGGLEGKQLESVTGVPGSVFCHTGLWLAVAASLDGAIQLAKLAIDA